jgi:hypothetical protein
MSLAGRVASVVEGVRNVGMVDTTQSSSNAARVIRTSGLFAEYSVGKTVAGEWFALGSVRPELPLENRQPAWMIVGTGQTAEDAVSRLLTELEREAHRYFR